MKILYLILLTFVLLLPIKKMSGCTNILITKGATIDGSTMITYAADSHELYGELYYYPAADYPEGQMLDIYEWDTGKYLGKIKQARHTYKVVGNMNENQVVIGETTFTGRTELKDSTGIIDYGSLIYITLQRAKNARHAIHIIDELTKEYGYYSTGESFSISDATEVWIMEIIGKGPGNKGLIWVAQRIPDGYISAHANQARITTFPLNDTINCLYSKDVISFAREKGYFKGKDKDFDFSAAYAPINFESLRFCESRVWSIFRRVNSGMEQYKQYAMGDITKPRMPLWIKPDKKLNVKDVISLMRDHFEGTEMDLSKGFGAGAYSCPYRWRPLTWELDSIEYFNERSISTQQTGFSFISQSRDFLPNEIGGLLWFGVDDTYSTCYVPMYTGINCAPKPFAVGTGSFHNFSWESAFWVFNFVSNYAYSRYSDMIKDIQKVQQNFENNFIANQAIIEKIALEIYKINKDYGKDYLTDYSTKQALAVTEAYKKLGEFLIYKYLDGNIKDENNKVTHPPYPEWWRRKVVEESGDFYKLR
jgi:dipeptidase